jgi:hypothetical protein
MQALRFGERLTQALWAPLDITRRAAALKGAVMCTCDKVLQMMKMAEAGVLSLGQS